MKTSHDKFWRLVAGARKAVIILKLEKRMRLATSLQKQIDEAIAERDANHSLE
jgi:hypothetical protein